MRTSSLCAPENNAGGVFNLLLQRHAFDSGYLLHILITTTREVGHKDLRFLHLRGTLHDFRDGMGTFERRHDALFPREQIEGRQRFIICHRRIFGTIRFFK